MSDFASSSTSPISIGVAVVIRDRQILIGKRADDVHLGGFYEFPGGKCDPSESPAACAIRECLEETGLTVEISETLLTERFVDDERSIILHFFRCHPSETASITRILPPFEWHSIRHLRDFEFPEGNQAVLQLIEDRLSDDRNDHFA